MKYKIHIIDFIVIFTKNYLFNHYDLHFIKYIKKIKCKKEKQILWKIKYIKLVLSYIYKFNYIQY